jgi:predicted amidohydrolase YtcJ
MANGFGITSSNESALGEPHLPAFRAADAAGEMELRVQASQRWDLEDGLDHFDAMITGREPGPGRRFKADAVKFFVDGDISTRTASLLQPYVGTANDLGTLNLTPERLNAIVTQLDAEDFQVHMHVVGDRAVRMGLDAIEHAIAVNGPRNRRHQLAHVKLIHPDDIPRFAELGVVADFQPLWAKADDELKQEIALLGPERSRWLMPINSVFKTGARVVAGSDWISESMNPLYSIQIAVTRQPIDGSQPAWIPEERVTLAQMIEAYTINGAWLARQEKDTGSIKVGKAADLIVLEKNLFEVDPMKLAEVKVLLTLLEGGEVYRHADFLAGFAPGLAPDSD